MDIFTPEQKVVAIVNGMFNELVNRLIEEEGLDGDKIEQYSKLFDAGKEARDIILTYEKEQENN